METAWRLTISYFEEVKLRLLLKVSTDGAAINTEGSDLHQVDSMELKARSPSVTDRVLGLGTSSSTPAVKSWSAFSVLEQFPNILGSKCMECLANKQ